MRRLEALLTARNSWQVEDSTRVSTNVAYQEALADHPDLPCVRKALPTMPSWVILHDLKDHHDHVDNTGTNDLLEETEKLPTATVRSTPWDFACRKPRKH